MKTPRHPHLKTLLTAAVAAVAALTLVACDKKDERTLGQQIDSSVAKVEQKAGEVKAEIKQEMAQAQSSTVAASDKLASKIESAADKLSTTVQDAAITTGINAALAKDDKLSALKINVDTRQGAVKLQGTAPDASSRERAARLAAEVKGVVSVDNQLLVRS